ncbi:MAG: hypothetical protein LW845_07805 [Flammeovirgaceae bacterium]|nr:hypothetical protein [Flammeovirgaceae bacterium]
MFLSPEVAGVGLNEIQAREKGLDYKVVTLDYSTIPRAVAKRNTQGLIKLLVTNDADMKILGMKVIGLHASSAIRAVALLISMDKGIAELADVRMLLGKSLFKPDALTGRITCRVCRNGVYKNIVF